MMKPVPLGRLAEIPASWRYLIAVAAASFSVLLRWITIPVLGSGAPYLWLFPAVLAVAILLGQGPGLVASAVGSFALELWVVPRVHGVAISLEDWGRIAVVMSSAVVLGEIGRRLRAAEAALVESDRRKDEFLAVLSHELRNPLGTIRSALTILDRPTSTPHDTDRAQAVIQRQLGHLSRLVDDLLDVSRIKTGKIRIERRPVDLREVTRRTVDDHLTLLSAHDLVIDLRVPDTPVWVHGDPTRLSQILGNLLQNASKFTPPGGRVLVSLETDPPAARLRVRDNGLGLDTDVRGRLFEPFAQADATLHRTRGGLGIGLALVKALVELHEGTVEATSNGPGTGCEFSVVLPIAPAEVATAGAESVADVFAQQRRILIIEDNRDFAAMLKVLLQLAGGHEVHLADNGPKGIDLARRVLPDVIVCDIGLPVMDGYEVARALRAQPATRDALMIALTGYASVEDAKRAEDAGFNYHVPKGGDPETVVRLLEFRPRQTGTP
jgi:signal transduction histidine kinase/ActR/RegA family two-component response regulator